MVEPVTTAGAAAAGATGVTGAIGDAVSSGVTSVANTAGHWFTNLLWAPFRAIGGAAQGIFGSLGMGAMLTLGITALKTVSPPLWRSLDVMIGGEARAARTEAMVDRHGMAGVVGTSAMEGFGLAATFGAARGASEGVGGGITGLLAGVGVMATGVVAANHFMNAPETPARAAGGRAASDTRHA